MFQVLSQVVDDKKKKKKCKTWDLVHHPEKDRNLESVPWPFQCALGKCGPPHVLP